MGDDSNLETHRFSLNQNALSNIISSRLDDQTEERPFSCSQCWKVFKRKSDLDRHEETHNEGNPYRCQQCDKAFKTKNYLSKHIKTHNKVKPYNCFKCGKGFKKVAGLKNHESTHNEANLPEPTEQEVPAEVLESSLPALGEQNPSLEVTIQTYLNPDSESKGLAVAPSPPILMDDYLQDLEILFSTSSVLSVGPGPPDTMLPEPEILDLTTVTEGGSVANGQGQENLGPSTLDSPISASTSEEALYPMHRSRPATPMSLESLVKSSLSLSR